MKSLICNLRLPSFFSFICVHLRLPAEVMGEQGRRLGPSLFAQGATRDTSAVKSFLLFMSSFICVHPRNLRFPASLSLRFALSLVCFFSIGILQSAFGTLAISNGTANVPSITNAWLAADVVSTNGTTNTVTAILYSGTTTWETTNSYGAVAALGAISNNVGNLAPATHYYYRWYISEGTTSAWANTTNEFDTPSQLSISNATPGNIFTNSAWLTANVVSTNGSSNDVTSTLYYGLADGGTNTWSNTNAYGSVTNLGAISNQVSSLDPAHLYYYRWQITEGSNTTWATSAGSFETRSQLAVSDGVISNIASTSAKFYSTITVTNGSTNAFTATLYYGKVDCSNNAATWSGTNSFAVTLTNVPTTFSTNITALAGTTKYYCRWYAQEGTNGAWSTHTTNFWTLAGTPTGTPSTASYQPVMVDSNGTVVSPTNFLGVNKMENAQNSTNAYAVTGPQAALISSALQNLFPLQVATNYGTNFDSYTITTNLDIGSLTNTYADFNGTYFPTGDKEWMLFTAHIAKVKWIRSLEDPDLGSWQLTCYFPMSEETLMGGFDCPTDPITTHYTGNAQEGVASYSYVTNYGIITNVYIDGLLLLGNAPASNTAAGITGQVAFTNDTGTNWFYYYDLNGQGPGTSSWVRIQGVSTW